MKNKVLASFPHVFFSALVVLYCVILITGGVTVKAGINQSIDRCLNVIIPSLFAFMVVSDFVTSSGLYIPISKPFTIISKYIMKIPPQLFFVFFLGNLAGYPMGIKLLHDMVKSNTIDKKTAKILSMSCYCGGPAFYSGTIGLAVFKSVRVGILIFSSIVISNFLLCVFSGHILKPTMEKTNKKINLSAQMLTDSILSAGKSLFTICIMIVFFSTIMSILENLNFFLKLQLLTICSDNTIVLIKSLLEITSITELCGTPYNLLPYITAICSFGGICVIIQVVALNKNSFSLKPFFLTRIPCAVMSAVVCKLLQPSFIPKVVETVAVQNVNFVKVNNFAPSICLILMILLLNYKKRLVFSKAV